MKQNVNHSLGLLAGEILGLLRVKGYGDVPSLHHSTGEVAAVLALHCNVFCAAELRLEGWRALVVHSVA